MGLKDRLVENRRRKLVEYVAERLETDDPVEASLPMTQSKNPLAPGVRFYGIAVLPSQVVVVGYPSWSRSRARWYRPGTASSSGSSITATDGSAPVSCS
jgi:hypothetical protein